MKKNLKKLVSVIMAAALMVMLFPLCGCPAAETGVPYDIAIVYTARNNNADPPFDSVELNNQIVRCVESFGSAVIVSPDGAPHKVAEFTFLEPDKKLSKQKIRMICKEMCGELLAAMLSSTANDEECDLLGAIEMAARALAARDSTHEKRIIVIDSGIATKGNLDLTKNTLFVDNQAVIDWLESQEAIPDLGGDIEVQFYGLGDVKAPQEALTPSMRNKLKSLWTDILVKAGCKGKPDFATDLPGEYIIPNRGELPYVTPIQVFYDDPEDFDISKLNIISEDKIGFIPDTADFLDSKRASEYLEPVAEKLLRNPSATIILAGTTATGKNNEACKKLGLSRANAVAMVLIDMGVNETQLEIYGIGYKHTLRVNDLNDDGSLNTEFAKANRTVILIGEGEPEKADYVRSIGLK